MVLVLLWRNPGCFFWPCLAWPYLASLRELPAASTAKVRTVPATDDVGDQPTGPKFFYYPALATTSIALIRSTSAYTWVTSAVWWPRTICATSRPYSRRIRVAQLCLNWCGCQEGTLASLIPYLMARR